MPSVTINYDGVPIPKARPRFGQGRAYTPEKTRGFEDAVAAYAREAMDGPPTDGPAAMTIRFYMPMPKSQPKWWKRENAGRPHWIKPDLDNLVKAVVDACQGVVYVDDKQIHAVSASKVWRTEPGFSCKFAWL